MQYINNIDPNMLDRLILPIQMFWKILQSIGYSPHSLLLEIVIDLMSMSSRSSSSSSNRSRKNVVPIDPGNFLLILIKAMVHYHY